MQKQQQAQIPEVEKGSGGSTGKKGEDELLMSSSKAESSKSGEKLHQVVCFNFGESGHYSTGCNKPRVCFICYKKDHVAENCSEWKKPHRPAQYHGSAASGLGFYHIDVSPREGRFKHWSGFDNYGVFTVEEGELTEEEILKAMKERCDKDWNWQLMKMEEYRYLIKFPPYKRVDSIGFGKATYFYLKKDTVLASVKVWDGDIEPVGQLTEAWVQIRGVPPKWSDWTIILEISLSLGNLIEVDWQAFFASFFSVIRAKISCKDPTKIPHKRVMEFDNHLYVINFKAEGEKQEEDKPEEDGKDNGDGGNDDMEDDDLLGEDLDSNKDQQRSNNTNTEGKGNEGKHNKEQESNGRKEQNKDKERRNTSYFEVGEGSGAVEEAIEVTNCINLLKAMEMEEEEEMEQQLEEKEEEEAMTLPTEWIYHIQ
ncbi:unnamed protein product [Urochloa humidicola]